MDRAAVHGDPVCHFQSFRHHHHLPTDQQRGNDDCDLKINLPRFCHSLAHSQGPLFITMTIVENYANPTTPFKHHLAAPTDWFPTKAFFRIDNSVALIANVFRAGWNEEAKQRLNKSIKLFLSFLQAHTKTKLEQGDTHTHIHPARPRPFPSATKYSKRRP